jgi:hypothetical protein
MDQVTPPVRTTELYVGLIDDDPIMVEMVAGTSKLIDEHIELAASRMRSALTYAGWERKALPVADGRDAVAGELPLEVVADEPTVEPPVEHWRYIGETDDGSKVYQGPPIMTAEAFHDALIQAGDVIDHE